MSPLSCHRCRVEFKEGERFYRQPIRIFLRRGDTFVIPLKQNALYHEKCLPPSLFHSGREFPHEWDFGKFVNDGSWPPSLAVVKTCKQCGATTTLNNWLDDEHSGDNRDACPSTRDLAWQTVPA